MTANPCCMVIFGGAGDLTRRLLMPSLYHLAKAKMLPDQFAVIGFSRSDMDDNAFREEVRKGLEQFAGEPLEDAPLNWLLDRLSFVTSTFDDDGGYERLKTRLSEVDRQRQTAENYLFYLATAPEFFLVSVQKLHEHQLTVQQNGQWRRIIIEKPFGHDLPTAQQLNRDLAGLLSEDQIYRIDHYLGKETVQNILAFRFGNGIFEPVWNRRYVDHVQITVAETVGVETRGNFYEGTGALRDMVPNHIMQLLCLIAMEPPMSFAANALRDEQTKLLRSILPLGPDDIAHNVVRGQYGPGTVSDQPAPGYRQEPKVKPDSATETFVAMKLQIDNWRWAGVPFYLRTGKRLAKRLSEIAIVFRCPPFMLFRDTPVDKLNSNTIVLRIQPDEGIALKFEAKLPGPAVQLEPVEMNFNYSDHFGKQPRTGYETLLYDSMIGDQTLYKKGDTVEAGWEVVQPVLNAWAQQAPADFPNYAVGAAGPDAADILLSRDGRHWRNIK